jgi:hypothetical protein
MKGSSTDADGEMGRACDASHSLSHSRVLEQATSLFMCVILCTIHANTRKCSLLFPPILKVRKLEPREFTQLL